MRVADVVFLENGASRGSAQTQNSYFSRTARPGGLRDAYIWGRVLRILAMKSTTTPEGKR